ncbi:MAG: glycosyltransferase [Lachnospiraceae bacterium]|nr:glycosyltransferase [Lachnospiraceae bacterium]
MKKIAFLINSLGKGGAEHVALNLAEHFSKTGYDVLLVTSRRGAEEYKVTFPARRRLLEEEIAGAPLGRAGKVPARIRRLAAIWREERPDLIVAFIGKMNLYAMLSTGRPFCRNRIPVILSVRSDPAREYPSRLQKALAERLFRRAAGVIFQTEDAKLAFSGKVQKHSAVLPNALDPSFVRERYTGKRENEIVMVGRLDANKNHQLLLRAFARLQREYPELKVVIYGGGLAGSDTEPALRALAGELGIADRVRFMGRQSDIRRRIERSRIFVLSSNYEGMPNALLEAMATGLAVISTDCPCGGPRTVIRDGENGLLIPVGDETALTAALRRILDDPELEESLGRQAAKLAQELAPEKVCRRWQEEIESRVKEYACSQS